MLAQRAEAKQKGRKVQDIVNRLHVAQPVKRDNKVGYPDVTVLLTESCAMCCGIQDRPPCIPAAVLAKRSQMETEDKRKTERDIELEEGDDYFLDLKSTLALYLKTIRQLNSRGTLDVDV